MDSGRDEVAQVTLQGSVCSFKKCLDVGWPLEFCTPYQVEGNRPSRCGPCQTHSLPVLPRRFVRRCPVLLRLGDRRHWPQMRLARSSSIRGREKARVSLSSPGLCLQISTFCQVTSYFLLLLGNHLPWPAPKALVLLWDPSQQPVLCLLLRL